MIEWRKKVVTILVIGVAAIFFLTVPASARHGTTKIEGCEASDMSIVLAADSAAYWEAAVVNVSHWRLRHVVDISCDDSSCEVSGGLQALHGNALREQAAPIDGDAEAERAEDRPVSLPSANALRDDWELRGHSAREIANALDGRAYIGADRRMHFVWLDYGQFNRLISIRGRTEIICGPGEDLCTITTSILVFIPYNERQRCGYISRETDRSAIEPVQPHTHQQAGAHKITLSRRWLSLQGWQPRTNGQLRDSHLRGAFAVAPGPATNL